MARISITPEIALKIEQCALEGLSIPRTAALVGVPEPTVRGFVARKGIAFQPGYSQRPTPPVTVARLEVLRACAAEGLSAPETARKTGIARNRITELSRKYGIKFVSGYKRKAKMVIEIRGVIYPDAEACAAALGVQVKSVYAALARGRQDFLGIGHGHRPKENRRSGNAKPFKLFNLSFPSRRAASLALGFSPNYLPDVIRKKKASGMEKVLAAAMRLQAEREAEARKKAAKWIAA